MSRLDPTPGHVYVVRWIRADGRDVRHRYYRRRHDARRFLAVLLDQGRDAALYVTAAPTSWREVRR